MEGTGLLPTSMVIPDLKINPDRLHADFLELARIGATPEGGVNRLALSANDIHARAWFADKIERAGFAVRDDDAGNLSGVLYSSQPGAKTLLLGSHLDSVPNGGKYDGAVGVVCALECLRAIKEAGIDLPINLEAIDFTDDEGCWKSLFGCRALTGSLSAEDLNEINFGEGSFRAALMQVGIDPRAIWRASRAPQSICGYLEVHIEQGPRLHRENVDIGIVTGIVGRSTYKVTFIGEAGHSGTTDMYKRRDALRGAALFIVRAHDLVRERYGDGIFNCGDISVEPGMFNVIPSRACLTVECRHVSQTLMAEMETALMALAHQCAATYALTVEIDKLTHMPAAALAAGMIQRLESVCADLNLTHKRLVSYSGHSAQILADFTDTGMIFIPTVSGISHHPDEFTEWDDVVNGANVLLHTVLRIAQGG
jgi:N-carbamoyl-L-amino-acid hydrolase